MTNRFLISVAAAALIAGTGFASAQGQGGATAQPGAPAASERGSPSAAPMNRDSGGAGMKGSDSGTASESNEKLPPGGKSANTNGNVKGEKSKSMSSETKDGAGGKEMKAEGRDGMKNDGTKAEGRNGNMNAETKGGADKDKSQTTGNAATSATAAPPAEKRTQIVSAIKSEKVEEVKNVNFNISVGTAVPASVRFHPLPSRIVTIYPEWRGYDFIYVDGRYIILRPHTHEIVYIIEG